MKKLLRLALLSLLTFTVASGTHAQTKVIHLWDFNQIGVLAFYNPSIPAFPANASLIDVNSATINYVLTDAAKAMPGPFSGLADGVSPGDTTANLQPGGLAGNGLRIRNPSQPDSMSLVWNMPTTGYKNIVVKYALQTSSAASGQTIENYDYSVDGGATWKSAGMTVNGAAATSLDVTTYLTWGLVTLTFGTDASVNNNPNLVLRIKFGGPNTSLPKGNNRFDNVTVEGIPLTGSSVHADNSVEQLSVWPNPTRNRVTISNPFQWSCNVVIHDVNGKQVYSSNFSGSTLDLMATDWTPGNYWVTVTTTDGLSSRVAKLTKE